MRKSTLEYPATRSEVLTQEPRITSEVFTQEPRRTVEVDILTGIVRTISTRPRLRLTLDDSLFNRVVYCYLAPDQQELARTVWNKRVEITGLVYRDAIT